MSDLRTGAIVHYSGNQAMCQAAIVVDVLDREIGLVNLYVWSTNGAGGTRFETKVQHSDLHAAPGFWHWPEGE